MVSQGVARFRRKGPAPKPKDPPKLEADMLDAFWSISADELEEMFWEPWRDGRNAVRLCCEAGAQDGPPSVDGDRALIWIGEVLARDRATLATPDYDAAQALSLDLCRSRRPGDVFYESACVILGNWIANSDGGGHVPNGLLRYAFWPRLRDGLDGEHAQELVGRWRAADFGLAWLGVDPRERLFRQLWRSGRYRIAVAITQQ